MRRFRLVLLVTLTAAGLGACSVSRSGGPATSSTPTTSAEETTTTTEASSSESSDEPPPPNDEPVTAIPADCLDGQCRLLVPGPLAIPLDSGTYHYAELRVVAVTPDSVSYTVPFPTGGSADQTLGVGGSGSFGFRELPSITVLLETVVNGSAVLNLTPGDPL